MATSKRTSNVRINTLRPRQNRRHFADDTFKHIVLNENVRISLKISLKFVPKVRINNIPALVPIMAWRRPGDKSLSEAVMDCLLTHICVTRPQWVNCHVLGEPLVNVGFPFRDVVMCASHRTGGVPVISIKGLQHYWPLIIFPVWV